MNQNDYKQAQIYQELKYMKEEKKDSENELIIRSESQESLLSVKATKTDLKLSIYGIPDQQCQKMSMYELQINNIASTPMLKDYFDTPQSLIQFMKVQNNLNINFQKGCIQLLSRHPTKQNQNIKIAQIQLHQKDILDNKNFKQMSRRCLSSNQLNSQQIKYMLLELTQQLMTLSQKPLRKKDKATHQNQCGQQRAGYNEKTKITKSVLEQEVDSVKEMMGRKIGKIMQEVQKSRQIFMNEIQIMKNRFQQLEKDNQVTKKSLATQLKNQIQETKSLITIDKNQLKQKLLKIEKNSFPQNYQGYSLGYNPMMQMPYRAQMPMPNMAQMMKPGFPMPKNDNPPFLNGIQPNRQQIGIQNKKVDNDLTLIAEIEPGQQKMKIKAKVMNCSQKPRNKVLALLGDHTGVVEAYLNKMDEIKIGNTILLVNCNAEVHKEHIQIQLARGGKIFEIPKRDQITIVNESNNLSQKAWVVAQQV